MLTPSCPRSCVRVERLWKEINHAAVRLRTSAYVGNEVGCVRVCICVCTHNTSIWYVRGCRCRCDLFLFLSLDVVASCIRPVHRNVCAGHLLRAGCKSLFAHVWIGVAMTLIVVKRVAVRPEGLIGLDGEIKGKRLDVRCRRCGEKHVI